MVLRLHCSFFCLLLLVAAAAEVAGAAGGRAEKLPLCNATALEAADGVAAGVKLGAGGGRSHTTTLLMFPSRLGISGHAALRGADERFEEGDEPPIGVPGVDVARRACLERKGDRLVVRGGKWFPANTSAMGGATSDTPERFVFLASDLCAMGHTTKDPAHLASWLLDLHEMRQSDEAFRRSGRRVKLSIIYGNVCMARNAASKANKRTPLFHAVLLGWFRAVLFGRPAGPVGEGAPLLSPIMEAVKDTFDIGDVEEVFYEDLNAPGCAADSVSAELRPLRAGGGFTGVVKRQERWRWLRTRAHTALFRAAIMQYHGVAPEGPQGAGAPDGSGDAPPLGLATRRVLITVLRRDEDRHFAEAALVEKLRAWLPSPVPLTSLERAALRGDVEADRRAASTVPKEAMLVDVQLVTFDNIRGRNGRPPPSHSRQLELLRDTDVLIAAHGAGLSGAIAMRPGSVVLELFPHNFRYYMYQELAQLSSLRYIPIESPVVHPPRCCSGRGAGNTMPVVADGIASLVNGVGARACKKCDIDVPDAQWRSLMRTAINHVLRVRGWGAAGAFEDMPVVW